MFADQLGHFKHRNLFHPAEDLLQFSIGINHASILVVLKLVLFDVQPNLLSHFGARNWLASDNGTECLRERHRTHEGRVRFTV